MLSEIINPGIVKPDLVQEIVGEEGLVEPFALKGGDNAILKGGDGVILLGGDA